MKIKAFVISTPGNSWADFWLTVWLLTSGDAAVTYEDKTPQTLFDRFNLLLLMVAIGVEGLKERYRINEPIEFPVIIKGFLGGNGFPRVKITNEKDVKKQDLRHSVYGATAAGTAKIHRASPAFPTGE